jgi:hypothetical protein
MFTFIDIFNGIFKGDLKAMDIHFDLGNIVDLLANLLILQDLFAQVGEGPDRVARKHPFLAFQG